MSYFFTSDIHICSERILERENRPFKDSEEFKEFIINLWNTQTKEEDIIYVVGDFLNYNAYDKDSWKIGVETVKEIKPKVILIIGNNEERIINECFNGNFRKFRKFLIDKGFYDVKEDEYLTIDLNLNLYLNHYPSRHKEGFYNLFGHVHRASGLFKPFGLNVGCDLNHFLLFSEKDIIKFKKEASKYWLNDRDVNS